jgi:hypothetical protein
LTGSEAPTSLERDARFTSASLPLPKATKVRLANDLIRLETNLDLDYWEIDPDWNGFVFRSAVQAQRHIRNGTISRELKIKAGRQVCVRLVTSQGEQYQLHI